MAVPQRGMGLKGCATKKKGTFIFLKFVAVEKLDIFWLRRQKINISVNLFKLCCRSANSQFFKGFLIYLPNHMTLLGQTFRERKNVKIRFRLF